LLIILDLSNNQLTGIIPSQLSGILSLAELDLSYNFLIGTLNGGITSLPQLNDLNLAENDLSCPLPSSGQFNGGIISCNLSQNVDLCSCTDSVPCDFDCVSPSEPTSVPTPEPTSVPTPEPTLEPTPSSEPVFEPTSEPTPVPTSEPTPVPTSEPIPVPTSEPTPEPTPVPTSEPTSVPTPVPTSVPTPEPTSVPTSEPTPVPTSEPTPEPTPVPTSEPTSVPTSEPTSVPTSEPTSEPTPAPTSVPTPEPTPEPTLAPTAFVQANQPTPNSGPIDVSVDYRPGMCPSYFTVQLCPIAILGSASFNVQEVNISTVAVNGVPVTSYSYQDVGTYFPPLGDKISCFNCTSRGPDGFLDLQMYFNCVQIRQSLDASPGSCYLIQLTGYLLDGLGTPIQGSDAVLVSCGPLVDISYLLN